MNERIHDRGVVLVSVLWIIMILSVAALSLATAARTAVSATGNDFDSERAFFMARGAAETVLYAMERGGDLFGGSRVRQDGGEFVFELETGEVRVRLETGSGWIDINQASPNLLASMFDSLDVASASRDRLVDSILDWRDADDIPNFYGSEVSDYTQIEGRRLPANGPFASVDELLWVNGMTEELFHGRIVEDSNGGYRRIPGVQELATVGSGFGTVNPNEASVDVLAALPGLDRELAREVVRLRDEEAFSNSRDLFERIPMLENSEALDFMNFGGGVGSAAIVARAEIQPSGVSRTMRLRYEERLEMFSQSPLLFRQVREMLSDGWRYE